MELPTGTRDKAELQRLMQLYTKIFKKAHENGVRLSSDDERELIGLTEKFHKALYG